VAPVTKGSSAGSLSCTGTFVPCPDSDVRRCIAREAGDDERQAIWDRARTIYAGFEAYASRIMNREIHIMILSAEGLQ
jgi:hypothetical protein